MNSIDSYKRKIRQLENELNGYQSAVEELKILNEIAVAAGKAANIDQTLNTIVQKTLKAFDAEQGLIYLVTPKRDIFQTYIKKDDTSLKHSYHINENITGWVLLHEKSLLIENLAKDKRFKCTEAEKKEIHTVLCSPVWFEGTIIGIILLINKKNKKSFTENELTLLSIIAVQAGQLIKNSQMQREALLRIKEAEIAQLKSRFFTNISHEFRTPLTLILGPAEKLLAESLNEKTLKQAGLIRQNALRLLGLINQLLDLSKLEAGKLKLETECSNIVSFVKGVTQSFESLAEQKDIELKVTTEKENIEIYFDKEKMLKILSNLLSNALKFSHEDGLVELSVKEIHKSDITGIEIKITDNGIGIQEEELPKLFERFYQTDTSKRRQFGGTGIGLALTKELVDLHRGHITVNSRLGEGSEFTIELPSGKKHLSEDEIVEKPETVNPELRNDIIVQTGFDLSSSSKLSLQHEIDNSENKMIVLIVEDNPDVRDFIRDSLSGEFEIAEAANGEQGIRKAEKIIPDLIISDITMPKIDGNEMTRILKNNEKTSHIPIILLTAKSGQESRLEALEKGADDYLIKPFDIKELPIRIKNLISIRKKLQEKYDTREFIQVKQDITKKLSDPDEKFMSKIVGIIELHLSEEDFSIEQFSRDAGMSRVQLHRKLKALTNKSASNFLRSVRLTKAKKLIEEQKGNVSEIAYSVGFSSPQYFTRCFKEEFGFPPSQSIK